MDTGDTILSIRVPRAPFVDRRILSRKNGVYESKHTCPMVMNNSDSLIFVALLSNRERNRVGGRVAGSGGTCGEWIDLRLTYMSIEYLRTATSTFPPVTILLNMAKMSSLVGFKPAGFDEGPTSKK